MGLDVPCKQEERKEVLAGGFRLFLPKVEGGQFVGLFVEIRYENLEGFAWKGGTANDDKVRRLRKRSRGGIERGGRSRVESEGGQRVAQVNQQKKEEEWVGDSHNLGEIW